MTPAMSAGVPGHMWSLQELLTYRIAPQRTNNITSTIKGHQATFLGLMIIEILVSSLSSLFVRGVKNNKET